MAGEYYDPGTGQIWYDDGQGNQWYVREANPWEQPGYQTTEQFFQNYAGSNPTQYFPPPDPYEPEFYQRPAAQKTVVRSYPEQRPDGSIWEVDEWSDGSYTDRMVQAPAAPAGYFGGGPTGGTPSAPVAGPSAGATAMGTAAVAAGSRGYQPGTELYQMLSQLYGPAIAERRLRELDIPQFQAASELARTQQAEQVRQFNEKLAFERAMNEFRQRQETEAGARAQAQLTGYFGGAPTLQREQYGAQLGAHPRDYVEYFKFTRPGQPIPVPAFAAQLAGGGQLGRPASSGGMQAGGTFFGLEPGQFTPRNRAMMTPSERAAAESLISAQGENPEDFYARAQQFFPFGRVQQSPRYTAY